MSGFEGGDQGWGSRSGVKVMRTRSVVKVGVMISGSKVGVKVGGSSSGSRSGVNARGLGQGERVNVRGGGQGRGQGMRRVKVRRSREGLWSGGLGGGVRGQRG